MSHKVPNTAPIHGADFKGAPMRPMIAEYDPKKHGVKTELSDMVLLKYKCEKNDVPTLVANGSTLPLVEKPDDEEAGLYNPFEHRKLAHPTSDFDTLIHLLKGSLGSGILGMPLAFSNAGLYFGLFATFFIGFVCTYCIHMLVKCAHRLCKRTQTPSLGFADVVETSFLSGPEAIRKYARLAKATVNLFLVVDLIGCCCVYVGFVLRNVEKLASETPFKDYKDYYALMLLPLLLIFPFVRNLKYLAPFSMIANFLIAGGISITFYYIFNTPDELANSDAEGIASVSKFPLFFGTAIFALEGIGVVMPLENNMKTPTHFIGCPGVLNIGMTFVVALYSSVGFFGYMKYGSKTDSSITENLPSGQIAAQCSQAMIAIAMFLTYGLQFHVPMEIIWKNMKRHFGVRRLSIEYSVRIVFVIATVALAATIPHLGPFMCVVGAVCLSTLGLIAPAVVELVTYWEDDESPRDFYIRLFKNIFIISFGILGFVTGTYVGIDEIIRKLQESK